jgi:F-type H+-transporting ATPase subunit epsilon
MPAAGHIALEIVTPDGVQLTEEVHDVTAPSVEGEFGVLPGHRPLLAALKTGIVTYHQEGVEHRVAVGSGFVEVADDHAVLLTDRFVKKADVDPVRARLELKEADEAIDKFEGEPTAPEYAELVAQENWAAVQLELYGDPPPPTIRTFHEIQLAPRDTFLEEAAPLEEAYFEQRDEKYEAKQRKKAERE